MALDPVIERLQSLGDLQKRKESEPQERLLQYLRASGVSIEGSNAEITAVALLQKLGVDTANFGKEATDPVLEILGEDAVLYVVPKEQRSLYDQVRGSSGVPYMQIVGRDGVLLFAGYPMHEMVESVLAEQFSTAGTE